MGILKEEFFLQCFCGNGESGIFPSAFPVGILKDPFKIPLLFFLGMRKESFSLQSGILKDPFSLQSEPRSHLTGP
jgi:hypothetical protein